MGRSEMSCDGSVRSQAHDHDPKHQCLHSLSSHWIRIPLSQKLGSLHHCFRSRATDQLLDPRTENNIPFQKQLSSVGYNYSYKPTIPPTAFER